MFRDRKIHYGTESWPELPDQSSGRGMFGEHTGSGTRFGQGRVNWKHSYL